MPRNFIFLIALCIYGLAAEEGQPPFEVHEWGVFVRTAVVVTGAIHEGRMKLGKEDQVQALLSAPRELLNDLPPFVIRHAKVYSPKQYHSPGGWDKPVLHLYGPEGLDVTVQVVTAQGKPTAYWPKPELLEETFSDMGSGMTEAVGLQWTGKLAAQSAGSETVNEKHWWKTAREVPSAWIKTAGGTERFLFYEATAVQEPVLSGKVNKDVLILKNSHAAAVGPVLTILNDGQDRRFVEIKEIAANGEVQVRRDELLQAKTEAEKLLSAARAQWESFGMTKAEARAIVEVWKTDLLEHPGFLVISRMPEELYGKMFPLTVTPAPVRTVRAGVVFDTLPGEAERLAWLPKLKETMAAKAKDLAHEDFEQRKKATDYIARLGDLARPFLEDLKAQTPDVETRAAAEALLKHLEPGSYDLPRHGKGSESKLVPRR